MVGGNDAPAGCRGSPVVALEEAGPDDAKIDRIDSQRPLVWQGLCEVKHLKTTGSIFGGPPPTAGLRWAPEVSGSRTAAAWEPRD